MNEKSVDLKENLDRGLLKQYVDETGTFCLIVNSDLEITYYSEDSLNFFGINSTVELADHDLSGFLGDKNTSFIKNDLIEKSADEEYHPLPAPVKNKNFGIKIKTFSDNDEKHYFLIFRESREKQEERAAAVDIYKLAFESFPNPAGILENNRFIFKNKSMEDFYRINGLGDYESFCSWIISAAADKSLGRKSLEGEYNLSMQDYMIKKTPLINNISLLFMEKITAVEKIIHEEKKPAPAEEIDTGKSSAAATTIKSDLTGIKRIIEENSMSVFEKFDSSSEAVISKIKSNMKDYETIIKYTSESLITMSENSSFIDEISIRIHLISINAAIESARSGEHGKGFAVISKEIAKLSEAIKGYAKSITSEIDNIKKYTKTINIEKNEEVINTDEFFSEVSGLKDFVKNLINDFKKTVLSNIDDLNINL